MIVNNFFPTPLTWYTGVKWDGSFTCVLLSDLWIGIIQWVHYCDKILSVYKQVTYWDQQREAQYYNTAVLIPSIPGDLLTFKVERFSNTSVVDISISCSKCALLLGGQVNLEFKSFRNTEKKYSLNNFAFSKSSVASYYHSTLQQVSLHDQIAS